MFCLGAVHAQNNGNKEMAVKCYNIYNELVKKSGKWENNKYVSE